MSYIAPPTATVALLDLTVFATSAITMSLSLFTHTIRTRASYALSRTHTMSSITSKTVVELRKDCLKAKESDVLSMHYTGTSQKDGRALDSSHEHGLPFEFKLGAGQVIRGWDEGLKGIGVGERRTLTLPPAYAYGPRGFPLAIPPNATLVFDVELLDIRNRTN